MSSFIQRALKATKKYTIVDFACLKIALIALGMLLGAYFADFFLSYAALLWLIYLAAFGWIIYRTFYKYMR